MQKVIISDPKKFQSIQESFQKGGLDKLHLISDFDRTISKAFDEKNNKVTSLISVLRNENYLSSDYSQKAHDLFNFYHQIEINPKIPRLEKTKHMQDWWHKHSQLLIDSGLNLKDIHQASQSKMIRIREKVSQIFQFLDQNNIPLIIISANGLGEQSILETLKNHNLNYPNIKIISNKFKWDSQGNAIESIQPHIHILNKHTIDLKDPTYYKSTKNRPNVILLGDSLGDTDMISNYPYNNLLKIGFLNYDPKTHLKLYKESYDVIITQDGSMDFVYDFLKKLNKNYTTNLKTV